MTYFDAASPMRGLKAPTVAALTLALAMVLAGCESAGSIFGGSEAPAPQVAAPPAPVQQPLRRVVMTPVIGAPDGIGKQLVGQLEQAAGQHKFAIATDRDARGDFTLRGYMVAARDRSGTTKLSYIWDVADSTGKRVHRITGEEITPAAPSNRDPWAAVTPALMQTIADKTAAQLGTWLPNQPASTTPVAAAPAVAASGAGVAGGDPSVGAPGQGATRTPASSTTTAALPRNDGAVAVVPSITGAPGDGNSALAEALQRELSRQGISLVDSSGAYRVEGRVIVGATRDGKQPIQIDWRVKDPQGKSLGTVSQKNEIPPGSLDGQWGKTAEAAAAAAAQGIIKLLPQARSTN